ncbi:Rhamnosyl O-methyltransferase [Candidatus Magnetomoraceae bacterium gMMP-15]
MDDFEEFKKLTHCSAKEMWKDEKLKNLVKDLIVSADRYNYGYQWTWLGLPIIQIPQDILVMQEIIWKTKPDIIIETGIARGGSLIFFASLLELIGKGRIIGIDIELRDHNRKAIQSHPLYHRITLIDGSSISSSIFEIVKRQIQPGNKVMVILDSNHSHKHVLSELRMYGSLVTTDQYLIVCDTVVEDIPLQTHRPRPWWGPGDNPKTALDEYLKECDRFEVDEEIEQKLLISSSPGGYLKCKK